MLLGSAVSICGGCIPLFVGMKIKSSKAALVASFVIMLAVLGVTQGNILPRTSFMGMVYDAAQILLAAAAAVFAACGIETEDVN